MSFFKKVGKFLKKGVKYALPAAGLAASFIPGIGNAASGLISSASSALGGMFSAKDGAQTFPVRNEGDATPAPTNWMDTAGSFLKAATPALVGGMNYYGQMQTNAANAQQAQKQMDFQNEQTSSAYQRGTADMKAAGLNPMLAYSQGGAQSGGGAQATMGNELGQGANSALSSAMAMQQMKGMELQNAQQIAETQRTHADTDLLAARRMDILEGMGTHGVNRAATEAGTKRTKIGTEFDVESFSDRLKQINSAWNASNASAEQSRASAANLGANTKMTNTLQGKAQDIADVVDKATAPIKKGFDFIEQGTKYGAEHGADWLEDLDRWSAKSYGSFPRWLRSYGKPKH